MTKCPETSPLHDKLFCELIQLAERCASVNECDVYACPKTMRCKAWFNRYAEISSVKNLRPEEQNRAIMEFSQLSLQFSFKRIMMRKSKK